MSETLTDILGQDIEPGDLVVYPQMTGRSVQMVLAEFQGYNGKTAKLLRQEGSRWKAEYRTTGFKDKRTGEKLRPYSDENWPASRDWWKPDTRPDWVEAVLEPRRAVTIRNVSNIIKVGK